MIKLLIAFMFFSTLAFSDESRCITCNNIKTFIRMETNTIFYMLDNVEYSKEEAYFLGKLDMLQSIVEIIEIENK